MKKKVEFDKLKQGTIFKRAKSRILWVVDEMGDATRLTGKKRGQIDFSMHNTDEPVTPVKVKIEEVK